MQFFFNMQCHFYSSEFRFAACPKPYARGSNLKLSRLMQHFRKRKWRQTNKMKRYITLLHLQPCRQVLRQANTQIQSYTHVTDDDQIRSTYGNIARTNNELRLHTISENSFFSFKSRQEIKTSLIFSRMPLIILHLDSK